MRLTDQELKKHNDKVMKIAELRCNTTIPGVSVSYPDYIKNTGWTGVQLALPCGVIRKEKRKVNAMQVRTGSYTTSLAKEKTKYDDQLGAEYTDPTDYSPFIAPEGEKLLTHAIHNTDLNDKPDNIRSKGILDL